MSETFLPVHQEILIIGKNGSGQFGIGHTLSINSLTNLDQYHGDKSITNIYLGHLYTIFSDKNHKNIWVAGNNDYGECAIQPNSDEYMNRLNKIDFFDNHDIKISQIFVRFTGLRTYWITNNNEVYGNGKGISNKPQLIPCLQSAVDIQSADRYSIALCWTDKNMASLILQYWSRSLIIHNIPNDIMELIMVFYHINGVFATNGLYKLGNNHYLNDEYDSDMEEMNDPNKWNEIEALKDMNIIKISTGRRHSLFLDSNGNVWNCCEAEDGDLGIIEVDFGTTPSVIQYFVEKDIKIRDIACGGYHNLAVDVNNKLYSWGYNDDAECGVGNRNEVEIPTLILEDQQIECIDCGFWHSYCNTVDGKHFLWGENDHKQCILEEMDMYNSYDVVMEPKCINRMIEERFPGKRIKSVLLGNDSTVVILEKKLL